MSILCHPTTTFCELVSVKLALLGMLTINETSQVHSVVSSAIMLNAELKFSRDQERLIVYCIKNVA